MKVGDTKQASILSIVAIAVVGFAIYRAIPPAPQYAPATAEDADDQGGGRIVVANLPTKLTYNPFSVLVLPKVSSVPKAESEDDRAKRRNESRNEQPQPMGGWPPVIPKLDPSDPDVEITREGTPPEAAPETSVKLLGIVGVGKLSALIAVNGAPGITVCVGGHAGPARVVSISSDQLVLSGPKGKCSLNVGDEAKL